MFSRQSAPNVGALGESKALSYLQKHGMKLVERNWRCAIGELDLIMREGKILVFVEVKSRRLTPYAKRHIFDNINARKQRKLTQLMQCYLKLKGLKQFSTPCRADVVGVLFDAETLKAQSIEHYKGVLLGS